MLVGDLHEERSRKKLEDVEKEESFKTTSQQRERLVKKVANFVGLNKVVLGIKWMNGMVKRRLSGGWTEI